MRRNEREPGELTPKQEKALSALLSEPTTEAAAKALAVARSMAPTLSNYITA